MSLPINIYSILKSYASHQNSGMIEYLEFANYVRRYAQKHLEENPDLTAYLTQSQDQLQKDIAALESQKKLMLVNEDGNITLVFIPFYVDFFSSRYTDIASNASVPFPVLLDLPKQVPHDIVVRKPAAELLVQLFEEFDAPPDANDAPVLYGIALPYDLPMILFPSTTNPNILIEGSIGKMRQMLRQEEYHEYFLKKLKISNPGKDISVKNFFNQFISKPAETLESLKNMGDSFFFWSQLCFFIRQDYEKVKDYTAEDTAVLQSVCITELAITYFKNKSQQNLQRSTALKNLETLLSKPPYYFNKETINGFTDTRGVPLLGQYSEKDLNDYLHEKTTTIESQELPDLLVFKTAGNEQRYYINKTKVLPLIMRLASDAHETVRDNITRQWYTTYRQFLTLPEMNDQKAFEKTLEKEVQTSSPVLYALLNSNFLSLVHYETQAAETPAGENVNLFAGGKLIPYSEMLLLDRHELITDAKIMLPWYYTVPIISHILSLVMRPRKKKQAAQKKPQQRKQVQRDDEDDLSSQNSQNTGDRKKDLVAAAKSVEQQLVPPESTLERELAAYIHQWNRILSPELADNLTEDVNSLIRDNLRKVLRTMQGASFTLERIRNLAVTLANTPALSKIKDQEELIMYIQLYLVKLVKNLS